MSVLVRLLSRCSKLFYIILSKYFYFASRSQASPQHSSCKQACLALHSVCTDIALRSCTAFACSALSHIARYAPSHRTNNYGTISQFKCKNNFEHLLIEVKIIRNIYLWKINLPRMSLIYCMVFALRVTKLKRGKFAHRFVP